MNEKDSIRKEKEEAESLSRAKVCKSQQEMFSQHRPTLCFRLMAF